MTARNLNQELDNLRKEILKQIPSKAVLFDEEILKKDDWYDDEEISEQFFNLPIVVIDVHEDYEHPSYGRVISIEDGIVNTYNDYTDCWDSTHIRVLSTDSLAYILLFI